MQGRHKENNTSLFSKHELERYSRQILLYGKRGQQKIKETTFLVVGAGGIASGLLPALVSTGPREIILFDDDIVERSNLGRQNIFTEADVGRLKVQAAKDRLMDINPYVQVTAMAEKFSNQTFAKSGANASIILEGSDSLETKFLVSDISVKQKKVAFIGALGPDQGHIFPILPAQFSKAKEASACYRCVFEAPPPQGEIPDCSTRGVLSALPHVVGGQMAYLASLIILEGAIWPGLQLIEKKGWRTHRLHRNEECAYCSSEKGTISASFDS